MKAPVSCTLEAKRGGHTPVTWTLETTRSLKTEDRTGRTQTALEMKGLELRQWRSEETDLEDG